MAVRGQLNSATSNSENSKASRCQYEDDVKLEVEGPLGGHIRGIAADSQTQQFAPTMGVPAIESDPSSEKLPLSTPNPTHIRGGKCHGAPRACYWIDNLNSPDGQG